MKRISILFLPLFILSACSGNEATPVSESFESKLHPAITEKPEKGDLFMVENDASESIIYAYIEKGSEVTVNEEENVLEVHFDEPSDSEDITLQTIEFNQNPEINTLKFYINGVETSLKSIIHE